MSGRWITGVDGRFALVDDGEDFQVWTRLYGWRAAGQPGPGSQTYVKNPAADLTGCIPYGALASGWGDAGWEPGPPPIPTDVTRPAPAPEPVPAPWQEPALEEVPKTRAAAGGQSKEK